MPIGVLGCAAKTALAPDLGIKLADLRLQMGECRDQHLQSGDGIQRQAAGRRFDDGDQLCGIRRLLRDDLPKLCQMAAQRIDRLRPLPDQKFSDPKDRRCLLGFFALYGHEAHRRALRGFTNGLGVSSSILLPLDEGLHIGGRDEPHLVAQLADLAASVVGTAARLHRHNTGPQLAEEGQHLIPSQLLAQLRSPERVRPMDLKNILRQVEPNRGSIQYDRPPLWILADPPWHIDAVGGLSHHQSHF
jgi:hypothetical protein